MEFREERERRDQTQKEGRLIIATSSMPCTWYFFFLLFFLLSFLCRAPTTTTTPSQYSIEPITLMQSRMLTAAEAGVIYQVY